MDKLDPLLHNQIRLQLMSYLMVEQKSSFTQMKGLTKATAGNLSVQISKLEEAGYINVQKSVKNNYPHTAISITQKGVAAFETYTEIIKKYLNIT